MIRLFLEGELSIKEIEFVMMHGEQITAVFGADEEQKPDGWLCGSVY